MSIRHAVLGHVAHEQERGFKHQNPLVAWWAKRQIASALNVHQDLALFDKLKQQPDLLRNFIAIFNSSNYDLRVRLKNFFTGIFERENNDPFLHTLVVDLRYYALRGTDYERLGIIGIFGSLLYSNNNHVKTIGYGFLEALLLNGGENEKRLALNQIESRVVVDNTGVHPSLKQAIIQLRGDLSSEVSNAAIRILSHLD
ncbi:MAG: hypothetical protein ABID61_00705 [Candidatus Micrarchaeota archaeon]